MEQLQQLLDSAWQMVVNNYLHVVAAIVILVVGRMVAGWARKLITRGLKRGDVDATLIPFVAKLVYYSILAVVVIAALNRLGVATTSVIAIFGAAGLAVGLALQGTLANFASGVMLLIFRPFDLGSKRSAYSRRPSRPPTTSRSPSPTPRSTARRSPTSTATKPDASTW